MTIVRTSTGKIIYHNPVIRVFYTNSLPKTDEGLYGLDLISFGQKIADIKRGRREVTRLTNEKINEVTKSKKT